MAARVLLLGGGACVLKATLGGSARGLAVEIAMTPTEAFERTGPSAPELVIIEGTDDDALEMVEALAVNPRTEALPVLVVGTWENIAGAARIVALGARLVAPAELALRHAIDETLSLGVHLGGLQALVADDDPTVTRLLGDLLRAQGCVVEEVHDGNAAFERALASPPDLVVTDLLMPGLCGDVLVQRMRDDAVLRDVPVALLSWRTDWLAQARGRGVDASSYLTKHADPQTVLTGLRSALAGRKKIEARLAGAATVRGQLDEMTPHRLLRLASRLRSDSRISVRDGTNLYDVQLRGGAPRMATLVSAHGLVIRGPEALESVLRLRSGRFVVVTERGLVPHELAGSLASQLAIHTPRVRWSTQCPSAPEPACVPPVPSPAPSPAPPPVPPTVTVSTQPLLVARRSEPVQVTVRLAPAPARPSPLPAVPPVASGCPAGAVRTVPLPLPLPAAVPPREPASVGRWTTWRVPTGALMRAAAVLGVAAGGLAVGAGLRVLQSAPAARSLQAPAAVVVGGPTGNTH